MVLLKRLMWPRVGEEVIVYRNGEILVEGHVISANDEVINIMNRDADTVSLNCKELSRGIDERTMTIKKKVRTGPL